MQAVVVVGCPRTGSNFLYHCVRQLRDVFATRFHEASGLHPIRSRTGLVDFSRAIHEERLLLIRIVRHPMEVAESFAVAKGPLRPQVGKIHLVTHAEFAGWINAESESFAAQRRPLTTTEKTRRGHYVVELRYERLATPAGREVAAALVGRRLSRANAAIFAEALEGFGKKAVAVRPGRLSSGISSGLTPSEVAFYRARCAATIKREGYK